MFPFAYLLYLHCSVIFLLHALNCCSFIIVYPKIWYMFIAIYIKNGIYLRIFSYSDLLVCLAYWTRVKSRREETMFFLGILYKFNIKYYILELPDLVLVFYLFSVAFNIPWPTVLWLCFRIILWTHIYSFCFFYVICLLCVYIFFL